MDWRQYKRMERIGSCLWIGARNGDGELIGYASFIIGPSLHNMHSVHALNDLIYLAPEARRGWNGVRLIRFAEEWLTALGVKKIVYHTKMHVAIGTNDKSDPIHGTVGLLLHKLGYKLGEEMSYKLVNT